MAQNPLPTTRRAAAAAALLALLPWTARATPPPGLAGTELVSRADPVLDSNGDVYVDDMSPDGRYVVLEGWANNLAPGVSDLNLDFDVFLHDRVAGTTTLVSHAAASPSLAADYYSYGGRVSADGAWVVFVSAAANLVAGQVNAHAGLEQIYLWERATGTVSLVSHTAGAPAGTSSSSAGQARISADGRYVAYASYADDLVAGQVQRTYLNAFLYDRTSGGSVLASHRAGAAAETGNGPAAFPELSADGRFLAFSSLAGDLVPGQQTTGAAADVFLFDRDSGQIQLASHASAAAATGGDHGGGDRPTISRDGRFVFFTSASTDLVPGQTAGGSGYNAFLYDRLTGAITLASHAPGAPLTTAGGIGQHDLIAVSADGRFAAFPSTASALVPGQVDTAGTPDLFRFDLNAGTVTLVSHLAGAPASAAGGVYPYSFTLSADGSRVEYATTAVAVAPGQTNPTGGWQVFVHDAATGANTLVSHPEGAPAQGAAGSSFPGPLSADGRSLAFGSYAADLAGGVADTVGYFHAFLWDGATGSSRLISRHAPETPSLTPEGASFAGAQSADGRWTAFLSDANNLVPGQVDFVPDYYYTFPTQDLFLADRATGTTVLVSHQAGLPTTAAMVDTFVFAISADGRGVAFSNVGTSLVAGQTGSGLNVFLYDRPSGESTLVSHADGAAAQGVGGVVLLAISGDGRRVLFNGSSPLLAPGIPADNRNPHLFLFDRDSGAVTLVSHAAGSSSPANQGSYHGALSRDGRWVAFLSPATDLVAGQVAGASGDDLFLYDRLSGLVRLVSGRAGSPTAACHRDVAAGGSLSPAFSPDGTFLAFSSQCSDLVAGQAEGNAGSDVFLYEIATGTTTLVSHAAGTPLTTASADSWYPAVSTGGAAVAFESAADDLVAGLARHSRENIYLWDRATGSTVLVSHEPGAPATTGDMPSYTARLSDDGSRLAFWSWAGYLVAGQTQTGSPNVFLYDRASGANTLASHRYGSATATGRGYVRDFSLSADGSCVVFDDNAADVVPNDYNGHHDVFRACTVPLPADLAVAVDDGADAAVPGRRVTYTITVTNHGPAPVRGAPVTDLFPAALHGVAWSCAPAGGAACASHGSGDLHDLADLPPGATATYTATGTVDLAAAGTLATLTDTAQVAVPAGLTDPDASNDSATDTDTLTAAAPAGVTVTPTAGLVTTERGGTAAFTVVLDRQPAAGVTIALASSDPHEGTVAPAALTFTAENWNVPQTATVTGAAAADDGDDEGDVPYTIVTGDAVSADPGYSGLAVADVAVTNRDDAGGRFHTLPPCRLLDTRRPQDGPAFVSGASQRLAVTGFCGIPAGARALALNVTVVAPSAPGNLVLHPGDAPPPLASTINFAFGANRANNAIVPLSADGTLAARPFVAGAGTVDVVLDVTGYFD